MQDIELEMQKMVGEISGIDYELQKIGNKMFINWDSQKAHRYGLHLTDITAPFRGKGQFCYRQHVLGQNYLPPESGSHLPSSTLAIFLEGWYVHMKWQKLFSLNGYAVEIEKTRLDPIYGIHHTPDIIAKFPELTGDELWIIEIKSMQHNSYEKAAEKDDPYKVHPGGYKQSQLYMYLTGIRRAALLLENKNTQKFRLKSFQYDPEFVAPYVHRMNILSQLQHEYTNNNRIPKRVCENKDTPRALTCPMRLACWSPRSEREKTRIPIESIQVNASLMHGES
jgi:hypothetical protein